MKGAGRIIPTVCADSGQLTDPLRENRWIIREEMPATAQNSRGSARVCDRVSSSTCLLAVTVCGLWSVLVSTSALIIFKFMLILYYQ